MSNGLCFWEVKCSCLDVCFESGGLFVSNWRINSKKVSCSLEDECWCLDAAANNEVQV